MHVAVSHVPATQRGGWWWWLHTKDRVGQKYGAFGWMALPCLVPAEMLALVC